MSTASRIGTHTRRVGLLMGLVAVLLALPATPVAHADDVPDAGRKGYDQAVEYVAAGGVKNLKKAFSALSRLKDKAARSVDYWALYVQVSRALNKPEKTTWAIIGKREAKFPKCPSFDLLRARLESDPEKKREHVMKAAEKAPDMVGPKLMLAEMYLADDDPDEASTIIDAVLEKSPDNEAAVVLKGHVELAGGYNGAALEYADEQLKKKDLPALHHLKARAYIGLHEDNDSDVLPNALKCAEKAVEGQSNDGFVKTLAYIHEKLGDVGKATEVVEKQFKKSGSAEMGALLGTYAVKSGRYKAAIPALTPVAATDADASRLLAQCLARTGDAAKARAMLKTMLAADESEWARFVAASVEHWLGAPKDAIARLEGIKEMSTWGLRGFALGQLGDTDAAGALFDEHKEAADTYEVDTAAVQLMYAHLTKAMGGDAAAAEKKVRSALAKTAKSGFARRTPRKEPLALEAKTAALMSRCSGYFRGSRGGIFARVGGPQPEVALNEERTSALFSWLVVADVAGPPAERLFLRFNTKTLKQSEMNNLKLEIEPGTKEVAAYMKGLEALRAGEYAAARTAFDEVCTSEPHWHLPFLGRAVATVATSPDKRTEEAKAAIKAFEPYPDDGEARHVLMVLAVWAGAASDADLTGFAKAREALLFLR